MIRGRGVRVEGMRPRRHGQLPLTGFGPIKSCEIVRDWKCLPEFAFGFLVLGFRPGVLGFRVCWGGGRGSWVSY